LGLVRLFAIHRDIQIRVTPPPEMVANLRAGNIDGFLGPDPGQFTISRDGDVATLTVGTSTGFTVIVTVPELAVVGLAHTASDVSAHTIRVPADSLSPFVLSEVQVPEPSSIALLAAGTAGFMAWAWRRRRAAA